VTKREPARIINLDEWRKKARQKALLDKLAANPRFREAPKGGGFMFVGAPRPCDKPDGGER
jgi:hypothetical protein